MTTSACQIEWEVENNTTENDPIQIRAWCLDENDKSVLVKIEDYNPFFWSNTSSKSKKEDKSNK